jgi:hypothetical protein
MTGIDRAFCRAVNCLFDSHKIAFILGFFGRRMFACRFGIAKAARAIA